MAVGDLTNPVSSDGRRESSTPDDLVARMWANNTASHDADGDSGEAVRLLRQGDQEAAAGCEARILADSEQPLDEARSTSRLLAALALT